MERSETITYIIRPSNLGQVLVAQSEKGICAILIDEGPAPLIADLQRRLPKARLEEDDKGLVEVAAKVIKFMENPVGDLDAPLDLRGTDFQKKVWRELLKIPAGTTISYREIAHNLGIPKASRAVGGAIAANALAVVIPCHRVVRSDGAICGYRWGVERKRILQKIEAAE